MRLCGQLPAPNLGHCPLAMWLYVAALLVTRGLLRSEKLVIWLRWFLDVEKAPFRSIGAVAAVLAFMASVAIILASAEVQDKCSGIERALHGAPKHPKYR